MEARQGIVNFAHGPPCLPSTADQRDTGRLVAAPAGGLYEGSFWMSSSISRFRVLTSFSLYRTSRVFSLQGSQWRTAVIIWVQLSTCLDNTTLEGQPRTKHARPVQFEGPHLMPITSYTGGGLGERSPSGGSSMVPLCSLRLTSFNCMQPSEGSDRQQQGTGRQDITPEAWAPSAGYLAVQVQHLLVAAATDGRRYDDLRSSGLDCSCAASVSRAKQLR